MNGEKGVTELPSYRSIIKRIGQDEHFNVIKADLLSWLPYLERQFHRLGWMSLPYAPLNYVEKLDVFSKIPTVRLWTVIAGAAAVVVCLAGLAFVRHKILLATLCLSGFVWAIPMRHHSATHPFESLVYTGIPLTLFLLVFCCSSFQMSRVGHDAHTAQLQHDIVADFEVIRRITEGKAVVITQDVTNRLTSGAFEDT